jgi:hypothetical protein
MDAFNASNPQGSTRIGPSIPESPLQMRAILSADLFCRIDAQRHPKLCYAAPFDIGVLLAEAPSRKALGQLSDLQDRERAGALKKVIFHEVGLIIAELGQSIADFAAIADNRLDVFDVTLDTRAFHR